MAEYMTANNETVTSQEKQQRLMRVLWGLEVGRDAAKESWATKTCRLPTVPSVHQRMEWAGDSRRHRHTHDDKAIPYLATMMMIGSANHTKWCDATTCCISNHEFISSKLRIIYDLRSRHACRVRSPFFEYKKYVEYDNTTLIHKKHRYCCL